MSVDLLRGKKGLVGVCVCEKSRSKKSQFSFIQPPRFSRGIFRHEMLFSFSVGPVAIIIDREKSLTAAFLLLPPSHPSSCCAVSS